VNGVTASLAQVLDQSGEFELACEISTDFPADGGISGLRELAGRYRTDYLLIYRHRFADQSWTNGWAWGFATGVGALFLPGVTMETAGVLEATLFDVKSGTILFTVFERTRGSQDVNNWHHDLKWQRLKARLLEQAAAKLGAQVIEKTRRLVAARQALENSNTAPVVSSGPSEMDPLLVNTRALP
jgi:hypothetical protein